MRKPFKAGRWTLDELAPGWWDLGLIDFTVMRNMSDADLRHIARLCAKALKARHQGKREAR